MCNIIKEWNNYQIRLLNNDSDFQKVYDIFNIVRVADDFEWCYENLEELISDWKSTPNFIPEKHMILIEKNEEAIGYGFVFWTIQEDIYNAFKLNFTIVPEHRTPEMNQVIYDILEKMAHSRLHEAPDKNQNILKVFNFQAQTEKMATLEANGYRPVRYFFMMNRPIDKPVIEAPMPKGLTVRPPREEEYQKVFKAVDEAFRDHYGHSPMTPEEIKSWMKSPTFQPHLWKVAWDGDEVAGNVLNYISEKENSEYGRKRGYTETISVRRPWRKKGLARALLTQSILLHRELGMEETALGVDATNPNGALNLYQSVGYEVISKQIIYQKDL